MAFQCCISSEQMAGMLRSSKVEASIAYNGIQTIRTYLRVEIIQGAKDSLPLSVQAIPASRAQSKCR